MGKDYHMAEVLVCVLPQAAEGKKHLDVRVFKISGNCFNHFSRHCKYNNKFEVGAWKYN